MQIDTDITVKVVFVYLRLFHGFIQYLDNLIYYS